MVRPSSEAAGRLLLLLLGAALIVLPALGATFPPVTDLPQHLGQARQFFETLRAPGGALTLQPLTPYWGAQAVLLPLWAALPARLLPAAAVALFGLLWVLPLHGLARARGRAPEAAVLAGLFFFSQSLYWGFLPFLAGWPVYLAWLLLLERTEGPAWKVWAWHLAGALLLYTFHALWFAMGLATLALRWMQRWPGRRAFLVQAAAVAPPACLAAWWFPRMAARAFHSPPEWFRGFGERFSPQGLASAALGGLKGPLEGWLLLAVLLWIGLALWQSRRDLGARVDGALMAPALLLLACALALPDKYSNTIFLAERWMPGALALLLLALPVPRIHPVALRAWALGLLLVLAGGTARAWRSFEAVEMTGLEASLQTLPEGARVLGLVHVRESAFVEGRPFMQDFAYALVRRGAALNFSFADFAPSPVVKRTIAPPPWTRGLEWNPEKATLRDLAHFTHVLAALPEEGHRRLEASGALVPLTREGVWRLYRVEARRPST